MGIGNYAAASSGFARELAASLTNEDVLSLAEDVGGIGLHAWVQWQVEHEDATSDYVAATPAQREKKKAWREPVLRRRLVLAAMTHCLAAHELQAFLRDHEHDLSPGGTYRDTTATAGRLYWTLMGSEIPHWPLELERVCSSPFAE